MSIDCPHAREITAAELIAREILVDFRPGGGIRLSPHFYNRDEEIELPHTADHKSLRYVAGIVSRIRNAEHRERAPRIAEPVL